MLNVRPGITDLASIVFADEGEILAGSADPDLLYKQIIRPWKSRLALLYVDRGSWIVDVQILLWTAAALLSRPWALSRVGRLLEAWGAGQPLLRVAARAAPLLAYPPPGARCSMKAALWRHRRAASAVFHALVVAAALACAFLLRFEFMLDARYGRMLLLALPVSIAVKLAVFRGYALRDLPWRYIGLEGVTRMVAANATASLLAGAAAALGIGLRISAVDSRAGFPAVPGVHDGSAAGDSSALRAKLQRGEPPNPDLRSGACRCHSAF